MIALEEEGNNCEHCGEKLRLDFDKSFNTTTGNIMLPNMNDLTLLGLSQPTANHALCQVQCYWRQDKIHLMLTQYDTY